MKKVAVFFDDPQFDDYPFSIDLYRKVYHQLGQMMSEYGGEFWIVRGVKTFLGHGIFSHGWRYTAGAFVHVETPVHIDVIWNKGDLIPDADTTIVNDPRLHAIACDKWKSYLLFPDLHARTCLIQNVLDWNAAMASLRTDTLVLKPLMGYGGEGIIIGSKRDFLSVPMAIPFIAQEFIDTSHGIPCLMEGLHDFRVIVMNGEIVLSYIRTPPPGKFTANVSQGGKEIEVQQHMIPDEVRSIIASVEKKFFRFPHPLYSIDMGREVNGAWKVFELNAKPGFSPLETGESYPPFFARLCVFLLSVQRNSSMEA